MSNYFQGIVHADDKARFARVKHDLLANRVKFLKTSYLSLLKKEIKDQDYN